MDANEAVSHVAYKFSELCGIYPITPASPMAELTDKWSNEGKKNYFDSPVKVVEMQSGVAQLCLICLIILWNVEQMAINVRETILPVQK